MQAPWKKYLIALAIMLLAGGFQASGQGRIYTRKARLADFQTKTTKVVLSGDNLLDIALLEIGEGLLTYEFDDAADSPENAEPAPAEGAENAGEKTDAVPSW